MQGEKIAAFIALLSSLITIFVFFTGIPDVAKLWLTVKNSIPSGGIVVSDKSHSVGETHQIEPASPIQQPKKLPSLTINSSKTMINSGINDIQQKNVILDKRGKYIFELEPQQVLSIRYGANPHPSGPSSTIIYALPLSTKQFNAICFKNTETVPKEILFKRAEFLVRDIEGEAVCLVKADASPLKLNVAYYPSDTVR